jgi:hypothetical protein
MRMKPPPLLPILRSQQQGRLLAALFLHPGRESTVAELAQLVGAPLSTMHREVAQLVEAAILRARITGRTRLVSAGVDRPLTELLAVTYGPQTVVGDEFGAIDDVDLVLIFGSWAARFHGEQGPPPADVDVLVVGRPRRGAVHDAAELAGARLGLAVNPVISSPRRWAAASEPSSSRSGHRPRWWRLTAARWRPSSSGNDRL